MKLEDNMYRVAVEEVHSGDDLMLMVDLGMDGLHKRTRARLIGVDTPNAFRSGGAIASEAVEVRDYVRTLTSRSVCAVRVHGTGKGGWLVTLLVTLPGSDSITDVNDLLRQRGYVFTKEAANG